MKLKQLSTEFEYFTPKWQIFGLIQLIFLLNIWTTTVQNFILINISTNMDTTNIFPISRNFFTEFWLFYPQNSNFLDLFSLASKLILLVFLQFSPSCFDILSWNCAYDFILMYYRSSLSVVTLCQFLKELCLFLNLEYRKCAVFHTFLLHASTYWAEILHMTLF